MGIRRESGGFVVGSLLFGLAAVPGYGRWVGTDLDNITYFVGSLFFTGAGFIALRLSGRPVPDSESERVELYDWWAAAIQFAGTLLFNVSTGLAMVSGLTSSEADKWVWRPDVFGSTAFLVASALAVVATTETDKLWDPHARLAQHVAEYDRLGRVRNLRSRSLRPSLDRSARGRRSRECGHIRRRALFSRCSPAHAAFGTSPKHSIELLVRHSLRLL